MGPGQGLALGVVLGAVLGVGIGLVGVLGGSTPSASNFTKCEAGVELRSRSYQAPRYFPFPPFRVVLESSPRTCDLAAPATSSADVRAAACASFSRGTLMMPEPFVVQTIASFLAHCKTAGTPCRAVDLGGNLGIHTAYMASLGATVEVVEAQAEMVEAIKATMAANCFQHRVTVHHAAISAVEADEGTTIDFKGGWQLAQRGTIKRKKQLSVVSVVAVQPLLRGHATDLLKIDIDNSVVESQLMGAVAKLTGAGEADVRTIVIEVKVHKAKQSAKGRKVSQLMHQSLSDLQSHGYHAYRLAHNVHSMDDLEEWYSPCIAARAYKYVLQLPKLSRRGWAEVLKMTRDAARARKLLGKPIRTTSLLLSREPIGRDGEAQWHSEGMEKTMPAPWRRTTCGGNESLRGAAVEAAALAAKE